jgi:hypothetical protein
MAEQILPGVSIQVRPEGLIIPGQVTVSNLGVIGTASRGTPDEPQLIGSLAEAFERFGEYDGFEDNEPNELTLTRALELAYANGAQTVIAVRIASGTVAAADFQLDSASGACCRLEAGSPGTWGNEIEINVTDAQENALVSDEPHSGPGAISLNHPEVVQSARNRIFVFRDATQQTTLLTIVYNTGGAPPAGQVDIDTTTGDLTFAAGEEPGAADLVTATYVVAAANSVQVTLRYQTTEEVYTVASGNDLVADVNADSALVAGFALANAGELPDTFSAADDFRLLGTGANTRGDNGAIGADYVAGLDNLLEENAHIIVAAGQRHTAVGAALTAHCTTASSDLNKRERVGLVGSAAGEDVDAAAGHLLGSDRIIFVAPGVRATDRATGDTATLPGGYAAAAVAGLISGLPMHFSPTNKTLAVSGLEQVYTNAELRQLVQDRVLALEQRFGFRVVKGITTSTNTAWHQITTRRIVDFAKFGVRSAANPYIGLLNNERVRSAMRSTINSFLTEMVVDERLVSYELEVSATRDEEIRGIARVTMVLRPTFSIDFIKVTMFLE